MSTSALQALLLPGHTVRYETRPLLPARSGPPAAPLTPEQLMSLFRVPPWICANIDGSSWGPLRRLAWRVRHWTWAL